MHVSKYLKEEFGQDKGFFYEDIEVTEVPPKPLSESNCARLSSINWCQVRQIMKAEVKPTLTQRIKNLIVGRK